MLNVWLVAKREYLERIRAKSFLIMTILIPVLMGGLVYGAALANGRVYIRGEKNLYAIGK